MRSVDRPHRSHRTASRAPRRAGRFIAALVIVGGFVVSSVLLAGASRAQPAEQVTQPKAEVPALPTGAGTIRGRIVHPQDPAAAADLAVALYALRPDGRPGLGGTRTDASGRFEFANVSEDPDTVYLVGTQYEDVPFGRRVAFEAGQSEIEIDVPIRAISGDASALLVVATIYKLDWIGSQLFVQVTHQLRNPDDTVIHVPVVERARRQPVFSARLPEGVVEFIDGQGGLDDGLARDGDSLAFWGPVYPGDQEVRYGFLLDGPTDHDDGDPDRTFTVALPQASGAGEVQILTRESDPRPIAEGLATLPDTTMIEEIAYVRSSVGGFARGGVLEVKLDLPASSASVEALRIARADYWIDADDTAMRVTAEIQLANDSAVRLLAPAGGSLLRFALPDDAEFLGVSGPGQALGVSQTPAGDIQVQGPVPPGQSSLGFRYSLPLKAGKAAFDLSFAVPVAWLNVLVADTGMIVESERLHRRRPFKQGTRSYLHREAYQVAADESIAIELVPFDRDEMPRSLSALAGLAVAVAAAAFLIVPLRRATRGVEAPAPVHSELALERENVYEALGDLEDDHATGKIDAADFERMRGDLRATAIDLLRRERDESVVAPSDVHAAATCPGCQRAIEPRWRFCSHCGQVLEPAATEPRA
jgi:hypothetical protein